MYWGCMLKSLLLTEVYNFKSLVTTALQVLLRFT